MLIYEYRIVLPMTVEEYQVAQLFCVAEASKNETGGGEGIEVVSNEPYENDKVFHADGQIFTKGQYTHKIYHLASKVPKFVQLLAPKGSLEMREEAWNAYPYCLTCIKNEYMKDNFYVNITTYHKADRGDSYNIHNLTKEKLDKRIIVSIDIANDPIDSGDYKVEEDPAKFKSVKTERGPLVGNWKESVTPVMCCYKLVEIEFKWFGLQRKVENLLTRIYRRLFTTFHRLVFCSMDKWHGLTMDDIRALEDKAKQELEELLQKGPVRGMAEK